MSTSMSTPINQLKNAANNGNMQLPKLDDDPMVQDVINSLVKEVKTQENIKSTPIGNYQPQPQQHQQPQPQQHAPQNYQQSPPQQPNQQYYQMMHKQQSNSLLDSWISTDDAKTAVIIAVIALIMLYPTDTSSIYSKFEFLSTFHQYDIFIRTALLAVILYIIFRKFKQYI